MKSKKNKPKRPNIHVTMQLEAIEQKAVENALDFLVLCKGFSFKDAKIESDCAYMAADKLTAGELEFTRGEIRASAKAIEFASHCLSEHAKELDEVAAECPEVVEDLQDKLPVLNHLLPRYQQIVSDLKKMK